MQRTSIHLDLTQSGRHRFTIAIAGGPNHGEVLSRRGGFTDILRCSAAAHAKADELRKLNNGYKRLRGKVKCHWCGRTEHCGVPECRIGEDRNATSA